MENVEFFGSDVLYLSLWNSDVVFPTDEVLISGEVHSFDYSRVLISDLENSFFEVTPTDVRNQNTFSFSKAESDWGIIKNIAIFGEDTQTLLFSGSLFTPKTVSRGDTIYFPTASLRFVPGESEIKCVAYVDNSYSETYENVLHSVMRAMKYTIDETMSVISEIHGFWTEFYYPAQSEQSAYGYLSDKQGYSSTPTKKLKVPVTGVMVQRFLSGDDLDNYFGPPPIIYMSGDESLPENTKVRILFGRNTFMEFQVDRTQVISGMDENIITALFLLPVSAQH